MWIEMSTGKLPVCAWWSTRDSDAELEHFAEQLEEAARMIRWGVEASRKASEGGDR